MTTNDPNRRSPEPHDDTNLTALPQRPDGSHVRARRFRRRPRLEASEVLHYPGAGDRAAGRHVKLSILMPAYNEERTLRRAVETVLDAQYPCDIEVIVVDDGSVDRTPEILASIDDPRLTVHRHPRNLGKGAALSTGAAVATGTHLVPFDTDLEYSPTDLPAMLEPIMEARCDVVYGTRRQGINTMYQSFSHATGNRLLTLAANLLYDSAISDLHTCLKLMPVALFRQLDLQETRFGLDTEVTARILKLGIRPFEVPITYHSRSFMSGKKITWRDGIQCLRVLVRVRLDSSTPHGLNVGDTSPVRSDGKPSEIAREVAASQ